MAVSPFKIRLQRNPVEPTYVGKILNELGDAMHEVLATEKRGVVTLTLYDPGTADVLKLNQFSGMTIFSQEGDYLVVAGSKEIVGMQIPFSAYQGPNYQGTCLAERPVKDGKVAIFHPMARPV
jgi:hypothetical protein